MESLSSRIYRIKVSAEGLSMGLGDRGDTKGRTIASYICDQLQQLEHEARLFEISPGLPSFDDWKPIE